MNTEAGCDLLSICYLTIFKTAGCDIEWLLTGCDLLSICYLTIFKTA